jgi:hypothetical protein
MGWVDWLKRAFGRGRPATQSVASEGQPEPPFQEFSSRTEIHESPIYGRVLEIALAGSYNHELLSRARKIIEEEVARHQPQYLVINLLEVDTVCGHYLLDPVATGVLAMQKLGGGRKTGIVAAGRTAASMDKSIRICRGQSIFGRTHSDLESALSNLRSMPALAKAGSAVRRLTDCGSSPIDNKKPRT